MSKNKIYLFIRSVRTPLLVLIGSLFLLVNVMNACSANFEAATTLSQASLSGGGQIISDPTAFAKFQAAITKHCSSCHGGPNSSYDALSKTSNFYDLKTAEDWLTHPKKFVVPGSAITSPVYYRLVHAKGVSSGAQNMPIGDHNMTEQEADDIAGWINTVFVKDLAEDCSDEFAPASIPIRRLAKDELQNAVRDLFGVEAMQELPDVTSGMFRTRADTQVLTDSFMQIYVDHAVDAAQKATQKLKASFLNQCKSSGNKAVCVRDFLIPYAERAFSRPVEDIDKQAMLKAITTVDQFARSEGHNYGDDNSTDGLMGMAQAGITTILIDSDFLYTMREGSGSGSGTVRAYSPYELAERLALLFYRSVPTQALLDEAASGAIQNNYDAVVERLVKSELFRERFSKAYVQGWLGVDSIVKFMPDEDTYGSDVTSRWPAVASGFYQEAYALFRENLTNNDQVNKLILSNKRYLSRDLASHLGISSADTVNNVTFEDESKLVSLKPESPYSGTGLLGTSILVTTSKSDHASLIHRGDKVLKAFLCESTPPPPNDVDGSLGMDNPNATERDLSLARRNDNRCSSCHSQIDPYGIGLRQFDGLGRFGAMNKNGMTPITSDTAKNGAFTNHKEMAQLVVKDDDFRMCMIELSLNYATSGVMSPNSKKGDRCMIKKINALTAGNKDNFANIIQQVAKSNYFKTWNDK